MHAVLEKLAQLMPLQPVIRVCFCQPPVIKSRTVWVNAMCPEVSHTTDNQEQITEQDREQNRRMPQMQRS
eukprot:1145748-Pelagomonas_calceolata.AAC.2